MWIVYALFLAAAVYFGPGGGLTRHLAEHQEQHQHAYAQSLAQVAVNMLDAGVTHQQHNTGFEGPLDPAAPAVPAWLRERAGDVTVLLMPAGKPGAGVYVFGIRQAPGVRGHIERMASDDVVIASYGVAQKHRGRGKLPQRLPDALIAYFQQHSGNRDISPLFLFVRYAA